MTQVLLVLTVEGFVGSVSRRIPHPLSYSVIRRSIGKRLLLRNGQHTELSMTSVDHGNRLQVWTLMSHHLSGMKFLWQYNSLKMLLWFPPLAFYQLGSFCWAVVLQSRLGTGYYCLLAIDILPPPITATSSPQLNDLQPRLNQSLHTDVVEKQWLGCGGTSHLPPPGWYPTGQLYKLWSHASFALQGVQGQNHSGEAMGGRVSGFSQLPVFPSSLCSQSLVCW